MLKPICPRCTLRMKRNKINRVAFYECASCLGVVHSTIAIKKVIEPEVMRDLWIDSEKSEKSSLPCAYCRNPMKEVYHTNQYDDRKEVNVQLDVCRLCHVIWMDKGEIEELPHKMPEKLMPQDARVALAEFKMQQMKEAKEGHGLEWTQAPGGYKTIFTLLGLPVEKEADHLRVMPWLTWLAIFLCTIVTYKGLQEEHFLLTYAFHVDSSGLKALATSVSSFFLHGSFFHWMGNMYFLWIFGDNVEDELGHAKYFLLLLIATFAGDFAFELFVPHSTVPLVGASGGISGVIAYYVFRFPRRKFVFSLFYIRWYSMPVWIFALLYYLKDLVGAFNQLYGLTNVSHISHIGGAIVGVLFAILWAPQRQVKYYRADRFMS